MVTELKKMYVDGGLVVSSQSPKGIFRPYGVSKWLDETKLNLGTTLLYILHNDIYLDIQNDFYGKEHTIRPVYYLKIFYRKKFILDMFAFEFSQDSGWFIYDKLVKAIYIKVPKIGYHLFGWLTERQYITIGQWKNN